MTNSHYSAGVAMMIIGFTLILLPTVAAVTSGDASSSTTTSSTSGSSTSSSSSTTTAATTPSSTSTTSATSSSTTTTQSTAPYSPPAVYPLPNGFYTTTSLSQTNLYYKDPNTGQTYFYAGLTLPPVPTGTGCGLALCANPDLQSIGGTSPTQAEAQAWVNALTTQAKTRGWVSATGSVSGVTIGGFGTGPPIAVYQFTVYLSGPPSLSILGLPIGGDVAISLQVVGLGSFLFGAVLVASSVKNET